MPWLFGPLKAAFPTLQPVFDNLFWLYSIPFLPISLTIIFLGFSRVVWDFSATVILFVVSVLYSYLLGCTVYYFKKKYNLYHERI